MTKQIVTANELKSGDVIYLKEDHSWTTHFTDSLVLEKGEGAEDLLEKVSQRSQEVTIVGPYLMDVDIKDGRPVPISQREIIRAKGPTVHPQFANQQNALC